MRARTLRGLATIAVLSLLSSSVGAQVWENDDHLLTLYLAQADAHFGSALAIGDFNGDGYGDIVVGAPNWTSPFASNAGVWVVFLGGANRAMTRTIYTFLSGTVSNRSGSALAAGDFDDDGRDEIAIGRPGATVGGDLEAGAVSIYELEGDAWQLSQALTQDLTSNAAAPGDQFGFELTVGNFNCDTYEDLAVGVPLDSTAGAHAGVVHVFYGGVSGLRTDNDRTRWAMVPGHEEQFGFALAAGDFDDDGCDDLAIGAPYRTIGSAVYAGAVEIAFGAAAGLDNRQQVLTEAMLGEAPSSNDYFGYSLAAANFNQSPFYCAVAAVSCYDDLAIGIPGRTLFTQPFAGMVTVTYGGVAGIRTDNATEIEPPSVGADPEPNDLFGASLAAGDLDHAPSPLSRYADLAIGDPGEDFHTANDGYVHLLFGALGGVDSALQEQGVDLKPGFSLDAAAVNDEWGYALAVGDLDGDGWGDLVVGVPYKEIAGQTDGGVVEVLYGGLFSDGFECQGTSSW